MKSGRREPRAALEPWEALATEAVGSVIGFWNFKRNHGRVWALLYLRDVALTAAEVQDTLALSKGAASMITRELEAWGVVRRVRAEDETHFRFEAETDLMAMIGRVLREREAALVGKVKIDLEEAEALAEGAAPEVRRRLARLTSLASLADAAIRTFAATARLDATGVVHMLAVGTDVPGSAAYVAIERIAGTLDGRRGSFLTQHSGTLDRGRATLTLTVVPDSGTGELAGLRGRMAIDIVDGAHFYAFDYELGGPAPARD